MKPLSLRLYPLLLLIVSGLLYFPRLAGTDLKEPNEPISAQAAREMLEHRDWIVPTVNGEPYPDKPPLLFWSICAASIPFGEVNEISARLPSAVCALALVLGVYFLARGALGPRGAFLGAATLAVSNFYVEQARYVQHDMLLCLSVGIAILALFRLKDGGPAPAAWMALGAAALAFGVLDKGPIALALPALILAADGLVQRTFFKRLGALVATGAISLVPIFLYYALLARRNGLALLETFLFRHNMDRFSSGFDHAESWHFFLTHSPVDLLPGTLLLPAAAALRIEDPKRREFHLRLWLWVLVPLVFFSLSASKRPVYMYPALPAVALLAGSSVDLLARQLGGSRGRSLAFLGEGVAVFGMGLAGLIVPWMAWKRAPELLAPSCLLGAIALAGAVPAFRFLFRKRLIATYGSILVALGGIWLVAILWVLPASNPINSPRFFAEEIARRVPADAPLMTYGLYRFRCGYIFYAHRLMPRLADDAALQTYLRSDRQVYCLLTRVEFQKLQARAAKDSFHVLAGGKAGRREEVLISNLPPPPEPTPSSGSPGTGPASLPPAARSGSGS